MASVLELQTPIQRASLGELVYQRIVDHLLAGGFHFGEELNEVALATRLGVSRTPVREALRRLTAEGLVVSGGNRQATVIEPSRAYVLDTYQIRGILEAAAAGRAATRMTGAQLTELRRLAAAAVPPPGKDWGKAERSFDERLHSLVAEACGNDRLRREIARYITLVRFVRSRVARNPRRLGQGHDEHVMILNALETRDAPRAEAMMKAHIDSAMQCVIEDLPFEEVQA
jgi:DNA-binding GntR family transcriptional regulator